MCLWKGSGGMLTSLNRLNGLPVIWQNLEMGYVEQAVADLRLMRLKGLVVRKGIGSARWSPVESISQAGRQQVELSRRPVCMPAATAVQPLAVITPDGCACQLCDVLLYTDTLAIAALEITHGPLYRLLGHCSYATHCRQLPDGGLSVPKLLSWTQLRTQLGEGDVP